MYFRGGGGHVLAQGSRYLVGIVFNRIFISINLYVPRTQMTLVLLEKGPCFGGLTFKNRGHLGTRYIYI